MIKIRPGNIITEVVNNNQVIDWPTQEYHQKWCLIWGDTYQSAKFAHDNLTWLSVHVLYMYIVVALFILLGFDCYLH